MSGNTISCPGCGSTKQNITYNGKFQYVECECGWCAPADLGWSGAIEAWNRRVYPAKVQAVLDAAKKFASVVWDVEPYEKWMGISSTCIEQLLAAVRAWKSEEKA